MAWSYEQTMVREFFISYFKKVVKNMERLEDIKKHPEKALEKACDYDRLVYLLETRIEKDKKMMHFFRHLVETDKSDINKNT